MELMQNLGLIDWFLLALGVLSVIFGIMQLVTKKIIGQTGMSNYTEESKQKYLPLSTATYIIFGVALVVAIVAFPGFVTAVIFIEVAVSLVLQFTVLKKK